MDFHCDKFWLDLPLNKNLLKYVRIFYLAASDLHLLPDVNDYWQQDKIEHFGP